MARVSVLANTKTAPRWAGDWLDDESLMPGGAKVDPAQFFAEDSVIVTVGAAGAAGGATTVPVAALSGPIPSGTVLNFGTTKFATLSAAAVAGATSLTVLAIPTALVSGDKATYPGTKEVSIPSGTWLGRTYAERDAGTPFGVPTDSDDEFYLLAFDVSDANYNNDAELYRHNGLVKETYLPFSVSGLSSTQKTKLRTLYECITGTN